MSSKSKNSRAGGKFGGGHTTFIPIAALIADAAASCSAVTKISPGFIKAGLPSAKGKRRVKITDDGQSILLSVRDNTSQQEVRIYTYNLEAAKKAIAEGAREHGLVVTFQTVS